MHPIWLATLDKARPVLILTRREVVEVRSRITLAPITTTVRGLSSEIDVGVANGLDRACVVNLDSINTVSRAVLIRPIGALLAHQEVQLTRALHAAFDLE